MVGRSCSDCGDYLASSCFSSNQWRKGPGVSRCKGCVSGGSGGYGGYGGYGGGGGGYEGVHLSYQCHECFRNFNSQNELNMHMQVHRPRNVSCPICGETRFRSGANAVQHVESGYCSGCRGASNARDQIYRFASSQMSMNHYLTDPPMLTNGTGYGGGQTPAYPYCCPECSKSFRQLSQLLQHQDSKHNNTRMLTY
mmetsp:Transcript_24658/g.53411  ORF Transcript_24658/g.53411 Transcript_24658/m.53411 type:complete len:196 (-) Transcript_24658:146-733(-)